MKRLLSLLTLLTCASLLASCAVNKPRRTVPDDGFSPNRAPNFDVWTTIRALAGDRERERVSAHATEEHPGDFREWPPTYPFTLHTVEYDDQGQFWNREQVEQSLHQIACAVTPRKVTGCERRTSASQPREKWDQDAPDANDTATEGAIVLVFAHGWFNNAVIDNEKLSCFRELLSVTSQIEHGRIAVSGDVRHPPRKVIGVYLGWRGGTAGNIFTFWSRKNVAHAIGRHGDVTEFLARLNAIQESALAEATGPGSRRTVLAMMGHSFGGALLYSSVAESLNAAIADSLEVAGKTGALASEQTAGVVQARLGDVVMLLNPALEASLYENIDRLARRHQFAKEQSPVFVTFSSQRDDANRFFFPIGLVLGNLFASPRSAAQWASMTQSIGTYHEYHTHELLPLDRHAPSEQAWQSAIDSARRHAHGVECRCPAGLIELGEELWDHKPDPATTGGGESALAAFNTYGHARFEPVEDIDPNNPFLIVRVDGSMVSNHGDVFNPKFVSFLLRYLRAIDIKKASVTMPMRVTATAE